MANPIGKVFLGTVEIAGYYTNLAAALRGTGMDCTFVQLVPHPFEYKRFTPSLPSCVRCVRRLVGFRQRLLRESPRARLQAAAVFAIEAALRIFLVLPWAAMRFDVFCFGFGSNIIGNRWGYWDVALLRMLGKRIIFMFHGADSRPPYMTGPYVRMVRAQGDDWPQALCTFTRKRRRAMRFMSRYANVMIDVPVHGHFHEKPFVDYACLGSPYSADEDDQTSCAQESKNAGNRRARILHAPSDRAAKGSDVIVTCIARLKAQGHEIEYMELHGMSNAEVMEELKRCDFVIDQIYADFPIAGFASEAASHGKAAIVCGYLQDRTWLDTVPTHYCHPDELEAAVTRMLLDRAYREELGRRAREFVRVNWSPEAVAQRWRRIIENDIPSEWWFDPKVTSYLYGGGMCDNLLRETLRVLVSNCGSSALQLDDKPVLRDSLLRMAAAGPARNEDGGNALIDG